LSQNEPARNDTDVDFEIHDEYADEIAGKIVDKIRSVKRPVVVGDFYAQRFGFGGQMRGLCEALGVRYFGSESRVAVTIVSTKEKGCSDGWCCGAA
jgi:TPP-dependent 2-oxoacid decarboxylase